MFHVERWPVFISRLISLSHGTCDRALKHWVDSFEAKPQQIVAGMERQRRGLGTLVSYGPKIHRQKIKTETATFSVLTNNLKLRL